MPIQHPVTATADRAADPSRAPAPPARAGADDPDGGARRWRRVHWGLVAVVVLAAALRWAWLDYARPVPVSDFRHYLDLATDLLDYGFFGVGQPSAWRLPAYPAVLAVAALVSRDVVFLSAVTAALSVVQVGLTYWLAWLVFRRRSAAVVAGLVAAVLPAFVTFAPVLASEHLLAVCVLGALIAALRAERRPWSMSLLAGVALGVAVLTRGEALAYLPVVALLAAVGAWSARPAPRAPLRAAGTWRGRALTATAAAALVVAGTAVVVGPWTVRNEVVVGRGAGLSTTGGFNFYLAHSPGPYGWRTPLPLPLQVQDEILRNEFGWTYGLQYARDNPDHWVPTVRQGTRELLAPASYAAFYATMQPHPDPGRLAPRDDLGARDTAIALAGTSSLWLLAAGLAGLAVVPVWRRRAWLAVAGIVAANWVVYAVIFWAQARYRFVIDALACVAVGALAAGVAAASSWVGEGWTPRRDDRGR